MRGGLGFWVILTVAVVVGAESFDPIKAPPPQEWVKAGRPVAEVTLATHLSAERVDALKVMRERWNGPLAISFYIRESKDVEVFARVVKEYPHADFGAVLHDPSRGTSYPVNLMRNRALDLVRTEYVLIVDGDFAPSKGVYEYIQTYSERLATLGNYTALVLPCFTAKEATDVPATVAEVSSGVRRGTVFPCGMDPSAGENVHAHVRFTDYEKWERETEWVPQAYEYPWEPYVIFKVSCAPRFDPKFIYYGDDKVQHAMHLSYHRFWFYILPFHFVVHVPHAPGKWAKWTKDDRGERARNFEKVKNLLGEFKSKHERHPEPPMCRRPKVSLDPPGEPAAGLTSEQYLRKIRRAAKLRKQQLQELSDPADPRNGRGFNGSWTGLQYSLYLFFLALSVASSAFVLRVACAAPRKTKGADL